MAGGSLIPAMLLGESFASVPDPFRFFVDGWETTNPKPSALRRSSFSILETVILFHG
jgi:hypothetical protein